MGQAILPKLLRWKRTQSIMMQVTQAQNSGPKGLLFSAETSARCPLSGTALRHNPFSRKRGNL